MELTIAILLLSAQFVDMKDDDGKPMRGTSVTYLMLTPGKTKANQFGTKAAKGWLSADTFEKLQGVGVYQGRFEVGTGTDGKPQTKLADLDFVKSVDLLSLVGGK